MDLLGFTIYLLIRDTCSQSGNFREDQCSDMGTVVHSRPLGEEGKLILRNGESNQHGDGIVNVRNVASITLAESFCWWSST